LLKPIEKKKIDNFLSKIKLDLFLSISLHKETIQELDSARMSKISGNVYREKRVLYRYSLTGYRFATFAHFWAV
jgi:hypothetical protein